MQVLVNLDCSGMITVFPECTVACFALIVLLRTAASYQLNTIRDDVSTGVFNQEMNVVGRHHVIEHRKTKTLLRLENPMQVRTAVARKL